MILKHHIANQEGRADGNNIVESDMLIQILGKFDKVIGMKVVTSTLVRLCGTSLVN